MRFDVLTLFPEFVRAAMAVGVVGRALERGRIALQCWNPRDYTEDNYRTVDDRPFGGGPGMVFKIEPLKRALAAAKEQSGSALVLLLSPQGRRFDQARAREFAALPGLVLVCGRYEAIDQRFVDRYIDEEVSIGDFVLSGGELPALAVIDAVTRLLPGVLHSDASAIEDSFMDGLLDCPHYTRPEQAEEGDVPPVLLSGNHAQIARWRRRQALGVTWLKRPDLLARVKLNKTDRALLREFMDEHQAKFGVD
ncbi:MAG: tRNA (guanosine(37)-N1)-methyltransferase TrmD [Xanthomonadales bacterium]|nr:tRNA (guanine-N(1)-)-methyltransferase [Xanthomonadales bacterium]MCC6594280.1 tRNA (guanosine(37)-N1)-methyltransferase TrmD [Xanthomonadales bacterium]MCE7930857.1 tRNA (guanosine(37)-N1)-methyltransferase TrmD [Xanthomonadales bacterium PRO6]